METGDTSVDDLESTTRLFIGRWGKENLPSEETLSEQPEQMQQDAHSLEDKDKSDKYTNMVTNPRPDKC